MNIKHLLKQVIGRLGIKVGRRPSLDFGYTSPELALAYNRHQALEIDFDFALRDFLMSRSSPDGVTFMQVGAFDGISGDPLHSYIRQHEWEGLLIEPQTHYLQQLQKTYADERGLQFVRGAIDHEGGHRTLYMVSDPEANDMPDFAGQIASFDKNQLTDSHQIPEDRICEEEVPTYNPMTLLKDRGFFDLDVVQIDVEGFDNEVVRMLDLSELSPSIIQFEHRHLTTTEHLEASKYLMSNGYQIARSSRADTVGYRRP
ncbi:FkbM family methyltransferase [Salinibacter ruber]|uniref:FkbM family methyltransferase n=1 Tax=Salinibacter ruber TaxID=146919 RepID=UPI0021693588|nr:FkbM family methyltransferase [Salinibacter ruber]MCS4194444.1 FkbM family methyltransferase [Salinibacter ruber]